MNHETEARPEGHRPRRSAASMDADVSLRYRRQARDRQRSTGLIDVVTVLLLVIPVGMWLAQGGVTGLTSVAGSLREVGVVTGLVATSMICVMLLLAARIPFVDHAIGHDRALLRHRRLSSAAVALLVVHALALIISYALSDQVGLGQELAGLWAVPDVALAFIGLGMFALVAGTSAAVVRLRWPHEVWFGVHLMSYGAVLVSLPHQFSVGGFFAAGPSRWYWAAMFTLSFGALLAHRVFAPMFASLDHRLRVVRVERIAADTVNIYLTGRDVAGLGAHAGQFFALRFLAPGLWWHAHPFSTSAEITDDTLRFTVRALGDGTTALQRVRPGTRVAFQGPYGVFSDTARTRDGIVLIGTGIGIAPIRALLESTHMVPGRALVVLRAGSLDECFLLDEIQELCWRKGAQLEVLIGHRDSRGGWAPREYPCSVRDLAPWVDDADVFVCGPGQHTARVVADLRSCGVPTNQIHDERFSL